MCWYGQVWGLYIKVLGEELFIQTWYFHDASLTLKSQDSREYGTIEIKEMTMWVFNKTSHVTPKV